MISKTISVFLMALLLHSSVAAQTSSSPTQSAARMQQVLRKAQGKDKPVTVILSKKIDNKTKLTGKVSEVSDTSFTVTDQKTGNLTKLAYEDVRQVNQKGMSKGSKIAIGIAVGAAAFLAVGVAVCFAAGPCRD